MGYVHTRWYLQLKDGVVEVAFKMLWKKLEKIIEQLEKLFEL